jgi:predicted metal-dependent HD superfamily phosphohydrolase
MEIGTGSVLLRAWTEPHRIYHSLENHLLPLLALIDAAPFKVEEKLQLAEVAWWHDAVYELGSHHNEDASIELYRATVREVDPLVISGIEATKLHLPSGNTLLDWFIRADLGALVGSDRERLKQTEELIFREFSQHYSVEEYTHGRLAFLERMLQHPFVTDPDSIRWLMDHVRASSPERAGAPPA